MAFYVLVKQSQFYTTTKPQGLNQTGATVTSTSEGDHTLMHANVAYELDFLQDANTYVLAKSKDDH